MPESNFLCPQCGEDRSSTMDACLSCGWPSVSRKKIQPEPGRRISRRTALGLVAGIGVLTLGAGAWIGLTRRKLHPPILTYTGHHAARITSLAWSSDGSAIASGDIHGNLLIWDTFSGKTTLTCREDGSGSVSSVAWSPDNTSLLVGYATMLTLRDARSGKPTFATTHLTGPAAYSPQGSYRPCYLLYPLLIAATRDHSSIQVFPADTLATPIATINSGSISKLAFDPNEGHFNLAFVTASPARRLVVYGASGGTNCPNSDRATTRLSFSAVDQSFYVDTKAGLLEANWGSGGSYLIGEPLPASVMVRSSSGEYKMPHPANVVAAALCPARQKLPANANPDGWYTAIGYIATADSEGVVRIWGNEQKYFTVMQVQQQVQTLAWSPDGTLLAIVTTDGVVRVWRADLNNLPAIWYQI